MTFEFLFNFEIVAALFERTISRECKKRNAIAERIGDGRTRDEEVEERTRADTYKRRYSRSWREVAE